VLRIISIQIIICLCAFGGVLPERKEKKRKKVHIGVVGGMGVDLA